MNKAVIEDCRKGRGDWALHCRIFIAPAFTLPDPCGMLVILLVMDPTAFILTSFKLRYKQKKNIGYDTICHL
jgi:hypothetical protein